MKNIWKYIKKGYSYLKGKKRRVALAMAVAANYVDDPAINLALNIGSVLLGSADGAEAVTEMIKNKKKLPSGIR